MTNQIQPIFILPEGTQRTTGKDAQRNNIAAAKAVAEGTTTAVVLAGSLLKQAEELLDDNIHPTIIAKGYRMAAEKAQEILNKLAEDIDEKDIETLKKVAMTAMTGKGAEGNKLILSSLA